MFAAVRFPFRAVWFAFLAVAGAMLASCQGCSSSRVTPRERAKPAENEPEVMRAEFEIYAFARVLGTIAPCGCTTEPLGGVQFAFGAIEDGVSAPQRLVVEPGSFLFPDPQGPLWPQDEAEWGQAMARAGVLQTRFSALGEQLVSGVGPTDVVGPQKAAELERFPLPRVSANVELAGLEPFRIVELASSGLTWRVGVTSVVEPQRARDTALADAGEPAAAVRSALAAMQERGAQFSMVLAQGDREFGVRLAQEIEGLDVVVVGVPEGVDPERLGAPPVRLGGTYVLEPGTQLQTMSVLHLSVDPTLAAVPELEAWTVVPPRSVLQDELARLDARLEKFGADPQADPAFLARLREEKRELEGTLKGDTAPKGPAVATIEQVKVTCKLPVDTAAARALATYEAKVSTENEKRFTGVEPPPPAPGRPGYAGLEACGDCHEEAVDFWRTTRHAGAYETLERGNKEFDLTCVGCHVTGYREPGGSEVVENDGLRDVQCEECHGPGSLHVEDAGDDLSLIERDAPAQLCASKCHTPEHSDTFEYEAYLRDVLGPGHGEARRAALGDGPTGRELRQAGLEAAGGSCKEKMVATP